MTKYVSDITTAPVSADGIAIIIGSITNIEDADINIFVHLHPIVEQKGSQLYTVDDLAEFNPGEVRTRSMDYEAILAHLLKMVHDLESNGRVKARLALDLFSTVYSENIMTSYENPDIGIMIERVRNVILDALKLEDAA